MENKFLNDNEESIRKNSEIESSETERRVFFKHGISALLTGLLGLNVINAFSQQNGLKPVKSSNKYKEALKRMSKPRKLITDPDIDEINKQIKQLDAKNLNLATSYEEATTTKVQLELKSNIDKFTSTLKLNKETGSIVLKQDGVSLLKDLSISKLESQIQLDEDLVTRKAREYFPNKVEILLNQAADLLDRGMKDRNDWDEKAVKFINLVLDLDEFKKHDELLERQVAEGLYDRDLKKSRVDLDGQVITQKKAALAGMQMKKLIAERFSEKAILTQQNNLRRVNTSYFFSGWHGVNGGPPAEQPVTFDDEVGPIRDFVNLGSLEMNQYNLGIQEELNRIQKRQLEANEEIATKNKAFYKDKVDWDRKNIGFRLASDQITRSTYAFKLSSFLSNDGILNYIKRMVPLKERFDLDFNESYTKLKSAEYGLQKIFDFVEPLPPYNKDDVQFFDNCITWTRKAINFINKSSQNQVVTSIPISLRSRLSNNADLVKAYEQGIWNFEVNRELLQGKYQIKLIAVSLSIVGLNKDYKVPLNLDGCFRSSISYPKTGIYNQKSGIDTILDISNLPDMPDIEVGAVYSNEAFKTAEIAGTNIVSNLSPLGQWKVTLQPIARPFKYQRKKNGKIKRVLIKKQVLLGTEAGENTNSTTGSSEDKFEVNNENLIQFLPTDFWDLKLDLHVTYLT